MTEEAEHPTAADMVSLIRDEFSGVEKPVTAEHFSALYGVLAAQSDTILALYALIMKAEPKLVFTDARLAADKAIEQQSQALSDALIGLAKAYGNTEGKP